MSFCNRSAIAVAAILSTGLGALPTGANPLAEQTRELVSQAAPDTWGGRGDVPILDYTSVRGRIVSINDDQVEVAISTGGTHTYKLPPTDQRLYGLKVGSEMTLTLRRLDNAVIAISDVTSSAGSNQ